MRDVVGGARRARARVRDRTSTSPTAGPAVRRAAAAGDPGALPEVAVDEDDLLAILYTSGTTGKPKGATITHRQVIANLQNIIVLGVAARGAAARAPPRRRRPDVQTASLLVVPLFHVTGCLSTMTVELRDAAASSC